jgi:hypothetical protein
LIVAAVQCLLVISLAGKYALDRERLPRVWVKTAPFDPNLPVRGRYVRLRLSVDTAPGTTQQWFQARLSVEDGRLVATPVSRGNGIQLSGIHVSRAANGAAVITEPVAFFVSEHVADPSRRAPDEELWVEVSVPGSGVPRPVRLGVKKDGILRPLELR